MKDFLHEVEVSFGFERASGNTLPTFLLYIQVSLAEVWSGSKFWICDKLGHKWVDTSHAGPDSGDMSAYCKRCGYSYHANLY